MNAAFYLNNKETLRYTAVLEYILIAERNNFLSPPTSAAVNTQTAGKTAAVPH
jgi:hypothetical protein